MDIYGYPSYRYSESDDLANQMFAQQALATSHPYSHGIPEQQTPEPHMMPAPSGAPWNMQGLPWGLPSAPHLVQFTGHTAPMEPKQSPVLHCKRRNPEIEPVIPAKQFITEEKMAAHLSGLHISTEYTEHSLAAQDIPDVMEIAMDSNTNINNKLKGYRLVLSEEIKKLKDEPLIPPALIERLEKPCMSLVLWKPKDDIIEEKKKDEKKGSSSQHAIVEESQINNRNGVLVPEYTMDVEM